MHKRTVLTALIGAQVALAVVGGFMALDKTTFHWYAESSGDSERDPVRSSPTTEARPAFTRADVMSLAKEQIARRPFPAGTNWMWCTGASYRSGNRMWVLTCEFRAEQALTAPVVAEMTYLFDDRTGKINW